jgi:hypothetical protein
MKSCLLILAACGGSSGPSSGPPPSLPFEPQTVQLQPDDTGPRFTMQLPKKWEQDRHLVGDVGGQDRLVNGAGEPDDRFEAATDYGDPELRDGHFELAVSCPGSCGDALEAKLLDDWHHQGKVVEESDHDGDHTLVVQEDDGDVWSMRFWHVDGDTRFHECAVRIDDKYAHWWPAFRDACAHVVEE